MPEFAPTPETRDRLREALDWAVFSIGALSLTVAIGATALS